MKVETTSINGSYYVDTMYTWIGQDRSEQVESRGHGSVKCAEIESKMVIESRIYRYRSMSSRLI